MDDDDESVDRRTTTACRLSAFDNGPKLEIAQRTSYFRRRWEQRLSSLSLSSISCMIHSYILDRIIKTIMRLPKRATLSFGLLLLVFYCVFMVSQLQRNIAKEEAIISELGLAAPNDGDGLMTVTKAASHFKKKIKRRGSKVIQYESRPRPIIQYKPKDKLPDPAIEALERGAEVDKKIASSISISSLLSFQNLTSFQQAKVKSSVDYHACCGLGHRMSKMVDANYVAKKKNLGLRISWGYCNTTTDIFHHFFGPQPLSELENVKSTGLFLTIKNESGGFKKLIRDGNATNCKCPIDAIEEHNKFYESLRQRFRLKHKVQAFQKQHLANHTVIGIHVRAGNGEEGDFVIKGRGINNTDSWIKSVSRNLLDIARDFPKPPRLFIATDTPSLITAFRQELKEKMAVVDYEQDRAEEGKGVLFGAAGKIERGSQCLRGWEGALMDMMILSYSDVVVAGRPSSFTQSLPITVSLAKPKATRAVPKTFCEFNPAGTKTWCYKDFEEWCCRGKTDFHLEGIRRYEFRRMPVELELEKQDFGVSLRLPLSKECPAFRCGLPYDCLRE